MRIVFIISVLLAVVCGQEAGFDQLGTGFQCDGEIDFELITGYVYSSADDIIDSKERTLELEECLQFCITNAQCKAVNFETGLCVLFKTSAGENSATLSVSQMPVFTLYAQKICIPGTMVGCSSPWAFETVPGMGLQADLARSSPIKASSRTDCALLCLAEQETCRSASYDSETGICLFSDIDRNMAGRRNHLRMMNTEDLIEITCQREARQKLCEFQDVRGRILKTVDSVFQDVPSEDTCKERCLTSSFACHSFDYNSAGDQVCRLSHHSRATLSNIQDPYIEVQGTKTQELKGCYNIDIECRGDSMKAKIDTTTLFNGKVYTKSRPNSCYIDIDKPTTTFDIVLPYNDIHCDVTQQANGIFAADLVIQHHNMIVTSDDVVLALRCTYELANTTVTNSLLSGLEVKDGTGTNYIKEATVSSPNVTMDIVSPSGTEVVAAQVGDPLALKFDVQDENTPYEIFVRDVVAMDGQDGAEILLIDERGCPTDRSIMQTVQKVPNSKDLMVEFQGFKFPVSDIVQFRALVTPCLPECEPANCSASGLDSFMHSSFGRKKRSTEESSLLVAKSVRITDKFSFHDALVDNSLEQKISLLDKSCLSFLAVLISAVFFIISQVIILVVWRYLWHKKQGAKHIQPMSGVPPEMVYGSLPSRTSSTSYLHN